MQIINLINSIKRADNCVQLTHLKPVCDLKIFNPKHLADFSVYKEKITFLRRRLERVLSSTFCEMPDYMALIPKNLSEEEVCLYLTKLFEDSKFFSRISTNEMRYGKNFEFAKLCSEISERASTSISRGRDFRSVLKEIASNYSKETKITKDPYREHLSGAYRGSLEPPEMHRTYRIDGFYTPYFESFNEYAQRFKTAPRYPQTPYTGFTMTNFEHCNFAMRHPYNEEVVSNMIFIERKYNELSALVKVYQKQGNLLSKSQRKLADDIISEIYYLMANTCPFVRGSNGISDILMRSSYSALGISKPHIKSGVSLDLESFLMPLDKYKQKWNDFFESM